MNWRIQKELQAHVLDLINDNVLTNENREDWHFHAFNENHYIIGYFEASEWLKNHQIDVFDAIAECQEYELDMFGEHRIYDNSESTVNMLVYIYGEEVLNSYNVETVEELKEELI
jgi:thermostable 8-oxoguanine DNA glycosylase